MHELRARVPKSDPAYSYMSRESISSYSYIERAREHVVHVYVPMQLKGMAPTTTTSTKQQLVQSLKAANKSLPCSDDDDVARQLVMGRWRSSLSSGLRAALACTIVGLFSLYAPAGLRRHVTFPAFSYVVTVILVTDATLGTALRGAVSALNGTLMGAAPSVAALWLAHRTGAAESVAATSAVVALTAFAVALPDESSVGPVGKRIALGQAIIIYVARFQQGERPSRDLALLHPGNVVACTALGVAAALLAVLLPWPRLATREARDKSRAYKLVAAERVRVLADAFIGLGVGVDAEACSRQRRWQMAACMSEANRLASASTTLLNRINAIKEDLQWERAAVVVDDNKSIEMPLTGRQIALATMQQADSSRRDPDQDGRNTIAGLVTAMRDQIRLALLTPNKNKQRQRQRQSTRSLLLSGFGSLSLSGSSCCSTATPSKSLYQLPSTSYDYHEQLQQAPSLFIFSLYQLHRHCCGAGPETPLTAAAAAMPNAKQVAPATTTTGQAELLLEQPSADLLPDDEEQEEVDVQVGQDDPSSQAEAEAEAATATAGEDKASSTTAMIKQQQWQWPARRRRLVVAAKCGFSLGLAVLLGLLFSNDHGFWSGLIVATTMSAGRESTWAVAVARAHGTALGSIYGVLCCLLMSQQRLLTMDLRFVALLPWMVLAAFLKRSRAYGPAGGVAAALSVVIIMGRRYDEAPMAFTITRLVETFIGISCAVLADLVFQPGARPSVQAKEQLTRCIAALADYCCSCSLVVAEPSSSETELLKRVQQELALLSKYAAEAGSEPTYLWLPPFPAACYDKIQGSLGRMSQLLQLYHQACRHQQQQETKTKTIRIQHQRFSSLASTWESLNHCLQMLAPPQKPKAQVVDLEAGTAPAGVGCSCCYKDDEVLTSFLAQAQEANLLLLNDDDDDGDVQRQEERFLAVCCLGSIALCMGEILREAQRLEAHILDLNNLQPSTH